MSITLRTIGTATLALAAAAAQAGPTLGANGYEIFVNSSVGAGGGNRVHYDYNSGVPGSQVYFANGNYSLSATQDTTGAARQLSAAATATATATGTSTGVDATTQDFAVDLSTGAIRWRANAWGAADAGAFLSFTDNVQFNVAGASASTRTTIGMRVYFDGLLADNGVRDPFNNPAQADANLNFSVGCGLCTSNVSGRARTVLDPSFNGGAFGVQWADGSFGGGAWTIVDASELYYDMQFDVLGAQDTLPFSMTFSGNCHRGASCDYFNTARFAFTNLPSNVTYSSASGVFLTAGTGGGGNNGVPEPTSLALVVLALGGLAAVRRAPTRSRGL